MGILRVKNIRLIAVVFVSLAFTSRAGALTIGDNYDLGLISKNYPADPISSAGFINTLLDQPLGSGPVTIGANTYTRTLNDPLGGSYPDAMFEIDLGTSTTINLTSGDLYLLAKYDGQNWGSEVWYVGDLTGTITIPQYPTKKKYGLSHVFLYTGDPAAARPVSDSGSTLALLGTAMAALGLLRSAISAATKRRT